jgi:hypothetical protein
MSTPADIIACNLSALAGQLSLRLRPGAPYAWQEADLRGVLNQIDQCTVALRHSATSIKIQTAHSQLNARPIRDNVVAFRLK